MTDTDLVVAADEYLALGLQIIALTGKLPNTKVHKHWREDCLSGRPSEPLIHRTTTAFTHPDTTGIGILTGCPLYVVDIDSEVGAQNWLELVGPADYMPETWVAKTGKGLHLYFADPRAWTGTVLAEKLDFKAEGGYVAAPPSLHPDGHRYEWLFNPIDWNLSEMPDLLVAELERRKFEQARRMASKVPLRNMRRKPIENGRIYPVATFDGIIQRMKDEPEGNRNGILYWAARTMLEEGADEEDLEELLDAATKSGLQRRESRRTIRSAAAARG